MKSVSIVILTLTVACHKNVYISSTPAGASIIDLKTKASWGLTPLDIEKPDGKYKIRIEIPGFGSETREFEISGGKNSESEKLKNIVLLDILGKRKDKGYWTEKPFYLTGLPAWTYILKLNPDGSISYKIKNMGGGEAWTPNWGTWALATDAVLITESIGGKKNSYRFLLHTKPEDSYSLVVTKKYGPYLTDTKRLRLFR